MHPHMTTQLALLRQESLIREARLERLAATAHGPRPAGFAGSVASAVRAAGTLPGVAVVRPFRFILRMLIRAEAAPVR